MCFFFLRNGDECRVAVLRFIRQSVLLNCLIGSYYFDTFKLSGFTAWRDDAQTRGGSEGALEGRSGGPCVTSGAFFIVLLCAWKNETMTAG